MTGAKYEYLGSNVHLYQEAYLKKGPGLGFQENHMPPMPTAPQTLKTHLAHRGTHTNKTSEEHTEADQLTNHQRDTTLTQGQTSCWCLSTHVELCHGSGPVSRRHHVHYSYVTIQKPPLRSTDTHNLFLHTCLRKFYKQALWRNSRRN